MNTYPPSMTMRSHSINAPNDVGQMLENMAGENKSFTLIWDGDIVGGSPQIDPWWFETGKAPLFLSIEFMRRRQFNIPSIQSERIVSRRPNLETFQSIQ
jgi:hypothetical protein